MFKLMASCFAWIKTWKSPERNIKLMIIGLDDAGKTTMVASLQGEPPDGITPTVGFSNSNLTIGKWNITLFDLGGGNGVRSVWEKYYAEIYGIIFVVDSVNESRIDESSDVLENIFNDSKVNGKPILILANKQDKEGALGKEKITERLHLDELAERYKFKFNVFSCSATKGYGKKTDQSINLGLLWLLDCINSDHQRIHEKVERESAIQKEIETKAKNERMERIRKLKEEREKAAVEAGIDNYDEDSEDDVVSGNPFRNIKDQIKVTEKREKKSKERDRKIKDFQEKKNELKSYTADEDSAFSLTTKKKKAKKKSIGEEISVEQGETLVTPRISLEEPTPQRCNKKKSLKKKGKTKEFVNSPDLNILNSNNLTNGKVPNRTNSKKQTFNDNYADFHSSPVINITNVDDLQSSKKTKKSTKNIYHDEIDCSGSLDQSTLVELPKFKPNKNYCKNDLDSKGSVHDKPKQDSAFNASRVDLFLARSSSESLKNLPTATEKKTKKGEIDTSLQFKKKKRKKTSRTAPLICSSPNNAQEQLELFGLRKNGHASKLEPIKLKGKIPNLHSDNANIPSWARARPNSEDQDINT